jgi:hypothetical protein
LSIPEISVNLGLVLESPLTVLTVVLHVVGLYADRAKLFVLTHVIHGGTMVSVTKLHGLESGFRILPGSRVARQEIGNALFAEYDDFRALWIDARRFFTEFFSKHESGAGSTELRKWWCREAWKAGRHKFGFLG